MDTNDQGQAPVESSELSQEETLLRILGEDAGEEPEAEESTDEEPAESEESDEPEESEESEEEAETEATFTIKYNGQDKKVSQSELVELAQKGFDYTQKTQAHAEQIKALEEKAKSVDARADALRFHEQLASDLLQEKAKILSMESTVEQYGKIDWQTWMDQDPAEAQKHYMQYQNTLRDYDQAKNDLGRKAQQQTAELTHYFKTLANEKAQDALKTLANEGWTGDTDKEAQKFLIESGFQAAELALIVTDEQGMPRGINHTLLDPRVLRIVADAMKYRKLQAAKPAIDKKVKTVPKVAKPGATTSTPPVHQELRKRFKQSNSIKDAAALWMATQKE